MAKVVTMQASLNLGEVSPRFYAQTQTPEYLQGLKTLINAIPLPQGGAQKRPGSRLRVYTLTDLVDSSSTLLKAATDFKTMYSREFRLVKYRLSSGDEWWLIMTNQSWGGGGAEWWWYRPSDGNLYPVASTATGLTSTNSYDQSKYTQSYAPYSPTLLSPPAIPPFDISRVQVAQAGDVLFLTHPDLMPLVVRFLDTISTNHPQFPIIFPFYSAFMPLGVALSVTNEQWWQTIPWMEPNQNNNYGRGSLTFTSLGGSNYKLDITDPNFDFGSTGTIKQPQLFRYTNLNTNETGVCITTDVNPYSGNSARVTVIAGANPAVATAYGTAGNTYWEDPAWSRYNGFPTGVAVYDNRVCYLGTYKRPNRIWFSAVGDVQELTAIPFAQSASFATYLDDNSRSFYVDIIGADKLVWASAGKRLFLGATNKEFVMFGSDGNFGPDSYQIDTATTNGSAQRQSIRIGAEMIFVQRSGQRLRNILFSFQEDDYKSDDITRLAEHVCRSSITNISEDSQNIPSFNEVLLKTSPDVTVWARDNNGGLSSLSFDRESRTLGWARHKLGGTPIGLGYGVNHPVVAAATITTNADDTGDEITLLVKRKVNGQNIVTLEQIGDYFNGDSYTHEGFSPLVGFNDYLRTRAVFMDCAQGSVPITPTNTFTFANMANETLSVVADGDYLGEYTLNGSGVLTLSDTYSEVIVGYKFQTHIETLNYEIPNSPSTNQGVVKQISEALLRLYRSSHFKIKHSGSSTYDTVTAVPDSDPISGPVTLFTGDKRVHLSNANRSAGVAILHEAPLPFELLGIIFKVEVS